MHAATEYGALQLQFEQRVALYSYCDSFPSAQCTITSTSIHHIYYSQCEFIYLVNVSLSQAYIPFRFFVSVHKEGNIKLGIVNALPVSVGPTHAAWIRNTLTAVCLKLKHYPEKYCCVRCRALQRIGKMGSHIFSALLYSVFLPFFFSFSIFVRRLYGQHQHSLHTPKLVLGEFFIVIFIRELGCGCCLPLLVAPAKGGVFTQRSDSRFSISTANECRSGDGRPTKKRNIKIGVEIAEFDLIFCTACCYTVAREG